MKRLPHLRWPVSPMAGKPRLERLAPPVGLPPRPRRGFRRRQAKPFAPPSPWDGRRRWIMALLLLALPLAVYWPTIFHHYGFRDDYSVLREAGEEPGKVFRVCAMQARPLYGWLMETSFRFAARIDDLAWIRGLGTVLLGVTAAGLFLIMRGLKWDRWAAAGVAALVVLLPSSQLIASWAVSWPLAVALLLALAAFVCAERSFVCRGTRARRSGHAQATGHGANRARPRPPDLRWWFTALALLTTSALIYPTNTLFYFAAIAAALWSRRRWSARMGLVWFGRHVVTLFIGLGAAFTIAMVTFARGVFSPSHRIAFEQAWWTKLLWFVREPLQNAFALFVLNQDGGSRAVHRFAGVMAVAVLAGLVSACLLRPRRNCVWWTSALLLCIVGSFTVNLVVADRWPVYRVLLPMVATIVVVFAIALLTLGGRGLARLGLLCLLLPAVYVARRDTFDLIAWPQSVELQSLAAGAAAIDPQAHPRVFVLTPTHDDHIAPRIFADEFGSLSTDSDWVPREMLKLLMRERYPADPYLDRQYSVLAGHVLPAAPRFDVVIDLRHLRALRPRAD